MPVGDCAEEWTTLLDWPLLMQNGFLAHSCGEDCICVEFLSHNIIRLQLVKIGILLMLSFLDD